MRRDHPACAFTRDQVPAFSRRQTASVHFVRPVALAQPPKRYVLPFTTSTRDKRHPGGSVPDYDQARARASKRQQFLDETSSFSPPSTSIASSDTTEPPYASGSGRPGPLGVRPRNQIRGN